MRLLLFSFFLNINCSFHSQICHGGEVPKEFYLENTEDFETMETITVGSGDKVYVEYNVENENCFLK